MSAVPLSATDTSRSRAPRLAWQRVLREPLLHFVLIGALIFIVAHVIEDAKRTTQSRVLVDDTLRQRLANIHRAQFGVLPNKSQLDTIVESYVDDEVLYREALRLGLDQDDEIIRRRLVQKLEFLQRDDSNNADVSASELRAYYDKHHAQFAEPGRVSFVHVYFNPDLGGDADALARATRARTELIASGKPPAGDDFPLDASYDAVARNDAKQLFGASPFVDALFTQTAGSWSQPLRSGFGWHLLKIDAVTAARTAPYEEVAPDVRAAYQQESSANAKRKQLDALRARYHVDYASDSSSISQ